MIKFDILSKVPNKIKDAAITDFSILLGGNVNDEHVKGDNTLAGRTGWYWTRKSGRESYRMDYSFGGCGGGVVIRRRLV